MRRLLAFTAAPLLASLVACTAAADDVPRIALERITRDVSHPVYLTHDPAGRIFIVEQAGRIMLMENGKIRSEPYLDIRDQVHHQGECGFLSIAFHPDFQKNGAFYANYTTKRPNLKTIIAEFRVDPAAGTADRSTERAILTVDQPYPNHNGGQIKFGPDGMLYIGMGDGGSGHDPKNRAQNPQELLGKMLRIGIKPGESYSIPKDNPFVNDPRVRPEIWALGLRNPWRFTFDRKTGECWTGDIGQEKWEEVHILTAGGNYGWNIREGTHPFKKSRGDAPVPPFPGAPELIEPIKDYPRTLGFSVTGGYVYRGKAIPALDGWYLYADFASGRVWGLKYEGGKVIGDAELAKRNSSWTSFGEDIDGELYLCDHSGSIFKIVAGD